MQTLKHQYQQFKRKNSKKNLGKKNWIERSHKASSMHDIDQWETQELTIACSVASKEWQRTYLKWTFQAWRISMKAWQHWSVGGRMLICGWDAWRIFNTRANYCYSAATKCTLPGFPNLPSDLHPNDLWVGGCQSRPASAPRATVAAGAGHPPWGHCSHQLTISYRKKLFFLLICSSRH
jgi:hypothetical protein